jgi:hypothetical protein
VGCQFIDVAIHQSGISLNAHKGGNSLNLHRGGSFIEWMGQFLRGFNEWATSITSTKVAIHQMAHSLKKWNWPIHLMNEPPLVGSMNCRLFNEKAIRWMSHLYVDSVNCCFGELPLWRIAALMNCRFDELAPYPLTW